MCFARTTRKHLGKRKARAQYVESFKSLINDIAFSVCTLMQRGGLDSVESPPMPAPNCP